MSEIVAEKQNDNVCVVGKRNVVCFVYFATLHS